MPFIEYFIKFSIWIATTWLFYRVFLNQLTFYHWNRFYLLIYSFLAFVVPALDITPWINHAPLGELKVVKELPLMVSYIHTDVIDQIQVSGVLLLVIVTGIFAGLTRLAIQFLSYTRIRKQSTLLHTEGQIRIFESPQLRGAFTFGTDIYINTAQHNEEDLKRILLHEIVHVKQRHTIDIVLGELICIFNWYNPFAWLLRRSIKQNLEFIADANVLSEGADPKQYQYLLLKVIGVPQYHIASHFNISDLKKRITMMNKIKSAKMHLSRFLFALPLLAVILLAFGTQQSSTDVFTPYTLNIDTLPPGDGENSAIDEPIIAGSSSDYNSLGYALSVVIVKNEPLIVIRQKNHKNIQVMSMNDWNRNKKQNEKKYGKLPPPPPPPPPPPAPASADADPAPAPPPPPRAPEAPAPKEDNDDDLSQMEEKTFQLMQQAFKVEQGKMQEAQVVVKEMQREMQRLQQAMQTTAQKVVKQQLQNEVQLLQEKQIDLEKQQQLEKFKEVQPGKGNDSSPR